MSDSNRTAYITVVEADDAVRDLIQKTVRAPNCVVDLARDEDEAVAKALQRWRKEWYSYSSRDVSPEFLSKHLQFWLGVAQPAPSLRLIRMPGSLLPWSQPGRI